MFAKYILGFLTLFCFLALTSALLAGRPQSGLNQTNVCAGINLKTLTKLTKDKDKAVAYTATAQLAAYYRREGDLKKAEKVLSKFSSPSGFDRLPANVAIPYLRCLLENAHIKALKKDLPGALQLLNWAESRKRDYERAFSCLKYAEILLDLDETERANAYLKNVRQILAKHINESASSGGAIGQGSKALDTESTWRTLRDQSDHLALEVEEVQLSKKFGATYASYVKLRRLQRIVKRSSVARTGYINPRYFNEAIKLCDEISETDPESQFAAAAGYLKGQLLLNNPTQDPKKAIKAAKDQLKKFIRSNPDIYQGEALILLGKISLEKEWDAKDAEKYYSQALTWFKQAREKRDALSLYAPMSNDLKTQTKATQKPTTLNKWKRTVYHEEDPLKLYNTVSAPSWYVSDKEKNCLFMLGFLKFLNGKYDEALALFIQVKKLSSNIAMLENLNTPNILYRLRAACMQKKMIFNVDERRKFKGKNFMRIAFAEMEFGTEHFKEANEKFLEIYKDPKSSKFEQAAALIGIGYCSDLLQTAKSSKDRIKTAMQTWVKARELAKKTSLERHAMWMHANYLSASTETAASALKAYKEYMKKYPKDKNADAALFSMGMCYFRLKKTDKMLRCYRKLKSKNPNMAQVKEFERLFKMLKNNSQTGKSKNK